ncbi:MAG: hypothetical protein ACI4J5_02260 [Oscillospiraceae bacterium]
MNFPEKTSVDTDYYYPMGFPEYPDGSEENKVLIRYRVHFLSQGASLSFLALVGDNEVTLYSSEPDGLQYVLPTVVQNGDMSSLTYAAESGYIGDAVFCVDIRDTGDMRHFLFRHSGGERCSAC